MSTDLTCFVFGIPLTLIWVAMFRKGVTAGPNLRKVERADDPIRYWMMMGFFGMVFFGFLIMPIVDWLGLRKL